MTAAYAAAYVREWTGHCKSNSTRKSHLHLMPQNHCYSKGQSGPMGYSLSAEELYFINEYIAANRKERIQWELSSSRKRSDCIWRFAHRARECLKEALVHPICIKNGDFFLGAKEFLPMIGNPEVFIVHPSENFDKIKMRFTQAFDEYLGSGPYIMIDCKKTFAFIETESGCETHEFLYLHQ